MSIRSGVAGPGIVPVADEQHRGFIDLTAPGVKLAIGMALGAAVVSACGAELAEGDGEAAGFGEEVPAEAEAVCPLPVAECPAGFDQAAVM